MRIVIVDNYDSFTYNLVQALGALGADVEVVRNDTVPLDALLAERPRGVVLSAGPGRPEGAGITVTAARRFAMEGVPVLGVCLGHQALAVAFGASIVRAARGMHGKTSPIFHRGEGLLDGLPSPFEATRYHSLAIDRTRCDRPLRVTARSEDDEIMAIRHESLPAEGVQFHPESILTRCGARLLANYLDRCSEGSA